jgi:hypothetical protein
MVLKWMPCMHDVHELAETTPKIRDSKQSSKIGGKVNKWIILDLAVFAVIVSTVDRVQKCKQLSTASGVSFMVAFASSKNNHVAATVLWTQKPSPGPTIMSNRLSLIIRLTPINNPVASMIRFSG